MKFLSAFSPFRSSRRGSSARIAFGLFLFVGAVYVATSPGRIDMIDGQCRYEVAHSLTVAGDPALRDPALQWIGVRGENGGVYSAYTVAASAAGAPLIALGARTHDPNGEAQRFLFSLTSVTFGAALIGVFFLFLRDLGVAARRALGWAFVVAFATLLWPGATTTFDNAQQAFFVLTAAWLGFRAAQRRSVGYAALGGLCAGALVNFVEHLVLLVPCLAISVLAWPASGRFGSPREWRDLLLKTPEGRAALRRGLVFCAAASLGFVIFFAYNFIRFGAIFKTGKLEIPGHPPFFGNPLIGLPGLLVSPGKGVVWYSPPVLLALFGFRRLRAHAPALGATLLASAATLIPFLSCILFFGGDWCWGPRYLLPILPLWSLPLAFLRPTRAMKLATVALVGAGLSVQLLAVSVDHQRFFLERALAPHFWATDATFYFRESALLARPGELLTLARTPPALSDFRPGPYPELVTYCIFGLPPDRLAETPAWMRQYPVFYTPRPWPAWMLRLPPERRPIPVERWLVGVALAAACGAALIAAEARISPASPVHNRFPYG